SVRIDVRRGEQLKNKTDIIGNHTKCKVVKNKVAPPFKVAEFDILYGKGISYEGEVLDLAILMNIIEKSGSWFSYKGEKIAQGRDNARAYLEQNPDVTNEIDAKIRAGYEKLDDTVTGAADTLDDDDDDELGLDGLE
ncbi:MAG: recombinase RecA, partial [Clostridia bacterium]|nr:recombinase RecA [Clostridia bacterium]